VFARVPPGVRSALYSACEREGWTVTEGVRRAIAALVADLERLRGSAGGGAR
jgi:hypothetical protein